MDEAIRVNGLTKFYGHTRGIEDLSFSIPRGVTYGFLGPNGAGKTTTIRCLLGLLRPNSGEAYVFGEKVELDGARIRTRIGYVAGDVRLYDHETGRWHIDYLSRLRGGPAASADELADRFEFDPSRKVKQLSKGNRQKLALVLALMHDPELLILDEPTSGLDPLNQQVVFNVIGERIANGTTVLLSSHILSEVEKVCDRVAIIREGRLVAEESMSDLLAKRMRHLDVTFTQPVARGLLDGIDGVGFVETPAPDRLHATIYGHAIDVVLKALATHDVTDVEIERASLEDVFLEMYRDAPARTEDAE